MLNLDNTESKKLVEFCYKKQKTLINPIIDWTTEEVWEFIREYKIPYCTLYDEGYTRLGCIGCPMQSTGERIKDFRKWEKYKGLYLKTFDRMLKMRKSKGKDTIWQSPEEVMSWWIEEEKRK